MARQMDERVLYGNPWTWVCADTLHHEGWMDGLMDQWIDEEIDRWNENPIGRHLWMEFMNGGMDKWGEGWQMDR